MPTLLIVAASPMDQDRLRLNAEVRDIREALQRSRNRETWKIESNEATTVNDLRRSLLDFRPTVVHFAGHGGGDNGLCFEDANGNTNLTDAEPLAKLFHHFKDNLKCVVLNACYSDSQGEVIRQEVDYVVGMSSAVEDDAARKFAVAFYDAVFAGTDFRAAFDLACTALDLNKIQQSDKPVFMPSPHLGGCALRYEAFIPEIERVLYAYLNTPYKDRCSFTTTGISLSSKMKQYYGENIHRTVDKVQVLGMDSIDAEHWRVMAGITGKGDKRPAEHTYYLHIHDRNVLIEWEATAGLWSIPAKTYLKLGSKEPVVARVFAELDNCYPDTYHNLVVQSVRLNTLEIDILHAYVKHGTPLYTNIMAILEDGNRHSITLEIQQQQPDIHIIRKLLSPTWLYSPQEVSS